MLTPSNPFEEAFQQTAPPPPATIPASIAPAPPPPQQQQRPQLSSPTPNSAAATVTATQQSTIPSTTTTASSNAPRPGNIFAEHVTASPEPSMSASSRGATINPPSTTVNNSSLSSSDDRRVLAKFRVDVPFKGKQVLRPITYFPIYTEVIAENDTSFAGPEIPNNSPHLRAVVLGVRRNDWTRGNCAMVERRYSEVQDFRELLVYQFPTLIIPPLPAKSGVGNVETYFNAGGAITTQRNNLQFFLKEIAMMPAVMFFSEWTTPFFLDPRDSFETGTLVRMRAALHAFTNASIKIHEFSQRRRSFTEDTANKIASTSTKIVRSVANFLWGGGQDNIGETNTYANTGSTTTSTTTTTMLRGPHTPGVIPNNTINNTPLMPTESASTLKYNFNNLPGQLREEADGWLHIMSQLALRQQTLKRAARGFERYLLAYDAQNRSLAKVAESMEAYELSLRDAESLSTLSEQYHLFVLAMDEVAGKEHAFLEGKHLNVCLRLTFESNLINAVLDAVDHVLCLFQSLACSHIYDIRDQFYKDSVEYAEAVSRALRADYVQRYRPYYVRRMRNLVSEQLVRPAAEVSGAVAGALHASSVYRLVREKDFLSNGGTTINSSGGGGGAGSVTSTAQ